MDKIHVSDWMSANPITISAKANLTEAYKLMKGHRIRRLPVLDENSKLVGIVTIGDIREAHSFDPSHPEFSHVRVEQVMTIDPITVAPSANIREAALLMLQHKVGGLPVVEDKQLVGIITESDIFLVLAVELQPHAHGEPVTN
jgi:acetoin utilization protein AcuB/CBS domain-containing protein